MKISIIVDNDNVINNFRLLSETNFNNFK